MIKVGATWYFFLITLLLQSILGLEKHWLPNLEWQTGNNWIQGFIPEFDSRIEFPLETRHAVSFPPGTLRFSGIDLPRDGILALRKDGKIEISDFQKTSKKISKWAKQGLFFWADPENWNISSEAVPHLDRVPCLSDTVVLPENDHVLSIRLPMTDIKVKAVKISDQNESLSQWEWLSFKNKRAFSAGKFSVRYSNLLSCEGCPCQDTNVDAYLEEICDIQRARCGTLSCEEPIKVEGYCCDFCGARVILSGIVFLPKLKRLTEQALSSYNDHLSWYVRKTKNGESEILVVEKGSYTGTNSQEAINNLRTIFTEEGITIRAADFTGAPFKDSRLVVGLSLIFGSLLVAVTLLLIVFLYFGYSHVEILEGWGEFWCSVQETVRSKGNKGKLFNFARFENISEGNVQLANPSAVKENKNEDKESDDSCQSTFGGRFENPLYRSKRNANKDKKEENDIMDANASLSLTVLQDTLREENDEEVEMNIEHC